MISQLAKHFSSVSIVRFTTRDRAAKHRVQTIQTCDVSVTYG